MAIGLHSGRPMLDVWSRAPRAIRRVAFFCGSLCVLLPALAGAQTTTVTAVWDPSPPSEQVSTYEVCIGTASRSCNVKTATVSAAQTSYVFAPPPGQMVYVSVRAVNSKGPGNYSAEQTFSIPSISALTNKSTLLNSLISPINFAVSDPDGSPLTFTHTGLPLGVTMNPNTGQITGTPTNAGTYSVTIFVNDGLTTVSRSFVWTVTAGVTTDRTPPTLTITSHTSGLVVTSASQTIRGTATDSGRGGSGITTVRVNGQAATGGAASGNNTANWSRTITLNSGSNTVSVEAVDSAGNVQMQQITLQLATSGSSGTTTGGGGSASSGGSTSGGGSTTGGGTAGGGTSTSSGPLMITALTSNLTSPQAEGTSITFTVAARGGRAPYQFKWLVFDGSSWTVVRNWSSAATHTWRPTNRGTYQVAVWARDSTTTADVNNVKASLPFRVNKSTVSSSSTTTTTAPPPVSAPSSPVSSPTPTSGPLMAVSLTSNLAAPQAPGTSITFTAVAAGGTGPYQFKWLIFDGTRWTVARDWSSLSSYTWRPTSPGGNRIAFWVRDSTTTADVSTVNTSIPYRIKKPGS